MGGKKGGIGTVVGGAIGFAAGGPLGAAVGAGIGGSLGGGMDAADAAQDAATAQAQAAREMRGEVLAQGNKNQREAMALAEATPQELASLGRAYASADMALGREEKMLAAIDPALMEASKQALSLLRGETADINKPMTDMRNMQREQLVNSLRAQYGPGAESSSIGQKALQSFDMQTNSMFAQNQQNALAQTFGIASSDFGGRLQRGISGVQQVGQGYSALQERKLNTQINTGNAMLGALSGTSQQMIQAAGAPYVGDALRGQMWQSIGNAGLNLAATYGGSYLGAKGAAEGAKAGGANPNSPFWE